MRRCPTCDALNLDPLLHMLGLDERYPQPWRNHYVASGSAPEIAPLVAAGLVEEVGATGFLAAGDRVFCATEAGRAEAVAELRRRHPKPSRARGRYLAWLDCADAYGVSFGEYLRRRLYDPASR